MSLHSMRYSITEWLFFNFSTLRIKAMLVVVGGMENKDKKMDIKR